MYSYRSCEQQKKAFFSRVPFADALELLKELY